jgi:FkbM family methyltransferase
MIHRLDTHQDQAGAWDVLLAASGKLAFDIGANLGQSTRVLARNFTQVVALEPCAESYEILATEMPENVFTLEAAASDHHGHVTLDEADRSIGTGQLVTGPGLPMWGERTGTRTVPCTTLDSLARLFGAPDFVKIDTEGSEVAVLAGARQVFNEARPRVIVEVHRAENETPVRDLLPGYRLVKLTHGDYVRQGGPVHTNHFWIVDERALP